MSFQEQDFTAPVRHNPDLHEIVIAHLRQLKPGHVLDIPAGPGYLVRDLQQLGFTGVAADVDAALHCLEGVNYAAADMTRPLPFPDASFDYIVSIEGVEHIENHFAFLREVRRVVRPAGKLILTTPNLHNLESRWYFLTTGFHGMEEKPIPLDTENIYFEHINPLSLPQLYFACERTGWRIEMLLTSRLRRGARLLYYLLYPWWRWGAHRVCFLKEKDPDRRRQNQRLCRWLVSRSNLQGGHTIIVASPR